ncbi:MAG: hypothetical protein R6U57_13840 [Anaerolineales bacterium]
MIIAREKEEEVTINLSPRLISRQDNQHLSTPFIKKAARRAAQAMRWAGIEPARL